MGVRQPASQPALFLMLIQLQTIVCARKGK